MNLFFRQPLVLTKIILSLTTLLFSAASFAEIQLYAPTNGWQNQQSKKTPICSTLKLPIKSNPLSILNKLK